MSAALLASVDAVHRNYSVRAIPMPGTGPDDYYDEDGLCTQANHEWMNDPDFVRAYERGVQAAGWDFGIHWRVHVALWVAEMATHVPGDFVECGVGRGMVSSAILEALPWSALDRRFFLVDSFLPYRTSDAVGTQGPAAGVSPHYAESVDRVRDNFAEWERIEIIQGFVPDVLTAVDATHIAYLHIDMNAPLAERAACEALWPRLSPGGWILFDDYAFAYFRESKVAADAFARSVGVDILSVATGQGLLQKPFDAG